MKRRDFLKQTGFLAATAASAADSSVNITVDPNDRIASSQPVALAIEELKRALSATRTPARRILVAGVTHPAAQQIFTAAGVAAPSGSEALALVSHSRTILAAGADVRGCVYAISELTDHVRLAAGPAAALDIQPAIVERPANSIRSITRCFVSDVEDKPWYNDRSMWPAYLSMLVAQRFNRFSLAFGIGYDFTRQIRDCYFHFPYPFLLDVPGYQVRAKGLPDDERDRNLAMLRYISEQTAARGLQFQLGIWTHAYAWQDSPQANYTIEGLTPENHAAYCRDALHQILQACTGITGVTLRVHGESGVAEGSYDFWKTLFDGIVSCGRPIEIDMHAKGMDAEMIQTALSTGLPVNVSPKFWAEHMGLPYHQAAIREQEMPRPSPGGGLFKLSNGERSFMRYSYGDLFKEDRRHGVLFRIWPGTQRLLLWGSPVMAAGYAHAFQFCGSKGVELCEPLSFKGRKGGGLPLGRTAYADKSLAPRWDWEKYLYTYRLWGRSLYNPESAPDASARFMKNQYGGTAESTTAALASASRILPLVTSAHGPSAANNNYWPELYYNMSIVDDAQKHPYSDTPSPKRFGAVSPFDPQMFSRIDDFADELVQGQGSGKYSPAEVAQWLEQSAAEAEKHLARAGTQVDRRAAVDIAIQSGLGRFFAWKIRSGILYSVYLKTHDPAALSEATAAYRKARDAWAALSERAKGVYVSDITFGFEYQLRGHWVDRLKQIDDDIALMAKPANDRLPAAIDAAPAIRAALAPPSRPNCGCSHRPPSNFRAGEALPVSLAVERAPRQARLYYRRVNQSEHYQIAAMESGNGVLHATIPAAYTASSYPLQYYFELRDATGAAELYPGLDPSLSNQPYFVLRRA